MTDVIENYHETLLTDCCSQRTTVYFHRRRHRPVTLSWIWLKSRRTRASESAYLEALTLSKARRQYLSRRCRRTV